MSGAVSVADAESFFTQVPQIRVEREALRHIKVGQVIPFEAEINVATLGDEQCVFDGAGNVTEDRFHLFG